MEQYILYILRDDNFFYVGKVKLEQAIRELNLHRSGKYNDTKDWFEKNKESIEIFWLESYEGTRKEAFGREIEWTRYFLDNDWTHSDKDSNIVYYANILQEELTLENSESALSGENQSQLGALVEEKAKRYSNKSIGVFMTEDEHAEIKEMAKDNNLSMSQYLKQSGLKGKVEVYDYSNLLKMMQTLSSMDQSLRHLVYHDYPNKELVRSEIVELTKSQEALVLEIRRMLRRVKRGDL